MRTRRSPSTATAVASLAAACAAPGAVLLHVSTDYVFDGVATSPYPEDAPTAPRTAYGRTKLAGERAVLAALPESGYVVRTAWLYGAHGANFVRTMIGLAAAAPARPSSTTSAASPPGARDVAGQIRALIGVAAPPGVYHATSSGETTWYGLASRSSICAPPERGQAPALGRLRSPGPRPNHQRRLPAPGAAPGLQRSRPRRLGGSGHSAHRPLARRSAPRLPRRARDHAAPSA